MPAAPYTIAIAEISQYLYSVSILKDNAFRNGSINNGRDIVIYMERKALEWGYGQLTYVPPQTEEYLLASSTGFLLINSTDKFLL
jgi:hypothetical protein